jgi:hypothetical protein
MKLEWITCRSSTTELTILSCRVSTDSFGDVSDDSFMALEEPEYRFTQLGPASGSVVELARYIENLWESRGD